MKRTLDERWYAVKAVFLHKSQEKYEERIIVIEADSFEEAGKRAEQETQEYVANLEGVEFIEWIEIFHIFDTTLQDKTEVYSKLTSSSPWSAGVHQAKIWTSRLTRAHFSITQSHRSMRVPSRTYLLHS